MNMKVMCIGKNEIKQVFCYSVLKAIILVHIVSLLSNQISSFTFLKAFTSFFLS